MTAAEDLPEQRIDQSTRLRAGKALGLVDGGVDGGEGRDAVEPDELVGADTENGRYRRVETFGSSVEDALDEAVQCQGVPHDAECQLGGQRSIRWCGIALRNQSVQAVADEST